MRLVALAAFIALATGSPALAQSEPGQPPATGGRPTAPGEEGWSVTIGVAPVLSPAWQGSDDMTLAVFPDLRVAYKDVLFASVPEGIGWNAVSGNGWKAGPIAKLRFGRDEDGSGSPFTVAGRSDALVGLGDIDASPEVGGFVEKQFGPWRSRLEVRRGFGGHEGVLADASLTYRLRQGRTIASIGPRITAASSGFMRTYFGIDAGQSAASGLATYDANGGILSYGLGATVVRPLDRRSSLTLFTGIDRLGDEAADSPLVRERGSATQFSLGIGYGFRFGL